jgi:alpha-beta hydrolase superfamily lysophospholipase
MLAHSSDFRYAMSASKNCFGRQNTRGKHTEEVKRKIALALKILFYGAIGCGAVVLAAYLWQRRMIYFPNTARPTAGDCRAQGLTSWPDSGGAYRGFIGLATPAGKKGLVVVFHGNAGSAADRVYYVHALAPLGYRVALAEYPGYGGRPGGWGERRFVADAKETVRSASEAFGGPLFLWGESLGCGVAAAVAADSTVPAEGLVMVTPWDSLPAVAQGLYWHLPIQRLVRDKYDNVRNLRAYANPIAVAVAEEDEIIPRKNSLRLYESLTAPKRLWIFAGAGHNSWPIGPSESWWREVMDFVSARQKKRGVRRL